MLPVTFGYSLSSEVVVMRQLRRWKRLWRRSLTRSYKRTSIGPEVVGTLQQVHCSRRRLLQRGLEFDVCTINKSAHPKNNLETYLMILVYIYIYIYIYIYTPLPPYGSVLRWKSNRVAISVHCKPLRIWIEVSATVERMYVNNSNWDSEPFKIYFAANGSSWLNG